MTNRIKYILLAEYSDLLSIPAVSTRLIFCPENTLSDNSSSKIAD